MRALPDLSDLPDLGSIFDPQSDDLSLLTADQPTSHDQLQELLDGATDGALADVELVSQAIDDLGTFSDALDRTFTYIHNSAEEIDYTKKITEVIAQELAFYAGLDRSSPDIGPLAASIQLYVDFQIQSATDFLTAYADAGDTVVLDQALAADFFVAVGSGGGHPGLPGQTELTGF